MSKNESLIDLLMVETSRRNTDLIADVVFNKPELFDELVGIYLKNEEPVSRRAVWVVDTVAEKLPELLAPYLESIAEALPNFEHDGLKRLSLRMLSRSPLPQKYLGEIMNICFDWLVAPKESVAVKIYAMEILYTISQAEPELKKELADSIEWRIVEGTPGFKNRGLKTLKKLYKEMSARKFE
jgi:hypothetical protein